MTTSKQLLSNKEQARLEKYNQQFHKIVEKQAPKHNCFAETSKEEKKRVNNSRFIVNMELRAKSEPKNFEDEEVSAHQFSVRDMSMQADSEERNEIALQTDVIDLKNMN